MRPRLRPTFSEFDYGQITRQQFLRNFPSANVTGKSPTCYGEVGDKLRTRCLQIGDNTEKLRGSCYRGIWLLQHTRAYLCVSIPIVSLFCCISTKRLNEWVGGGSFFVVMLQQKTATLSWLRVRIWSCNMGELFRRRKRGILIRPENFRLSTRHGWPF